MRFRKKSQMHVDAWKFDPAADKAAFVDEALKAKRIHCIECASGESVFAIDNGGNFERVNVGDWLALNADGVLLVFTDAAFTEMFEPEE